MEGVGGCAAFVRGGPWSGVLSGASVVLSTINHLAAPGHETNMSCMALRKEYMESVHIYKNIQVSFSGWYRLSEHYGFDDSASINDHSITGHMK